MTTNTKRDFYYHKVYTSPKSKARKKLQNTYFHLNADCVRTRNPIFEFHRDVLIHEEIKKQLLDQHKRLMGEVMELVYLFRRRQRIKHNPESVF